MRLEQFLSDFMAKTIDFLWLSMIFDERRRFLMIFQDFSNLLQVPENPQNPTKSTMIFTLKSLRNTLNDF